MIYGSVSFGATYLCVDNIVDDVIITICFVNFQLYEMMAFIVMGH